MSDDMSIPNSGYRTNRSGRFGRAAAGMDPDTRRLVLFAGGLAAVLVCLVIASTLIGHRSETVPVVSADPRPIRVKPDNPGGMRIDGAENDVFSGGVDKNHANLAPGAETPDPKGLHATAVVPPKPAAPAQGGTDVISPPPVSPAPVAPNAASPRTAAVPAPATASVPAPPVHAASPPVHAAVPPVHTVTPTGRAVMVQLAALSSEQAAREEWQRLAHRMPGLLDGRKPSFLRTEHDGRTFWRVRTAGFADAPQAKAFCEQVRSKGGGCSVADF